jgi:SAM-dependent methyltransferase
MVNGSRESPGWSGFGHTERVGFYEDRVLPRIINVALGGAAISEIRGRVAAGLDGEVLEVGFGSGLNIPHYPSSVRRVMALDPAKAGRKMARKRIAASPVAIEFVDLEQDRLSLESESVDGVLITWTMCTILDVAGALQEMHRVLRPGGQLHFAEHGLSPDPKVARWQHRLTPLQKRLAGGCHLDRPIEDLVDQAGFTIDSLSNFYTPGPKAGSYMYEGVATRP